MLRSAVGDRRQRVADTTLADSGWLATASALLLLTADVDRVNVHFAEQPPLGRRGERYVWLEAGHVSQNLYLAATERGLGAVLVAGFDDVLLGELLVGFGCCGADDRPVAVVAVGQIDLAKKTRR